MFIIRADANPSLGMGHIMRCLSIADSIKDNGKDIVFILADNSIERLITSRGYDAIILHTNYKRMESELDSWPELSSNAVIVDSYYVTPDYLNKLKRKIGKSKLIYIDDLATFAYPVDILVNYNVYGPDLNYSHIYSMAKTTTPKLLLGPKYTPLRTMFRGVEKNRIHKTVKNVLVSTGGSDPAHIALSLITSEPKGFTFHFLVGALNQDKETIKRLSELYPNIIIHENVSDMRSLISSCDIAISAAGSTLYEICACGVPLITYSLADNQIPGANAFEELGLAVNIGDIRDVGDSEAKIITSLEMLSVNYKMRAAMGKRMQKMIDGFGADRIAKAIVVQ